MQKTERLKEAHSFWHAGHKTIAPGRNDLSSQDFPGLQVIPKNVLTERLNMCFSSVQGQKYCAIFGSLHHGKSQSVHDISHETADY